MEKHDYLIFKKYLDAWHNETILLSNPNDIMDNEHFKAICQMGEAIVPYIINEIEEKPGILVWALNVIYGRTIGHGLTVTEACEKWVEWFKSQNK